MSTPLILAAIAATLKSEGASYFERPAGSAVEYELPDGSRRGESLSGDNAATLLQGIADDGGWTEVTDEANASGVAFGACRYFRAAVPAGFAAFEAVALVEELTEEELTRVRVVKGHHGFELQDDGIEPRPTEQIHVCVGDPQDPDLAPTAEHVAVFMWYPGRLTAAVALAGATVKLTR
jgi:hypothetical protein